VWLEERQRGSRRPLTPIGVFVARDDGEKQKDHKGLIPDEERCKEDGRRTLKAICRSQGTQMTWIYRKIKGRAHLTEEAQTPPISKIRKRRIVYKIQLRKDRWLFTAEKQSGKLDPWYDKYLGGSRS